MKTKQLPIKDLDVGTRFREDLGDLSELVKSIQEKGFIMPIGVTNENKLIWGGRRVAAAIECGLDKVLAVTVDANEASLREIELLENVARKDMSWQEKANLEAEIMKLKGTENPKWTIEDQAEFMGSSVGGTHRRLELSKILDAVPELGNAKTEDEAWKKWKKLQEEVVLSSMRQDRDEGAYQDAVRFAKDHYQIGDALAGLEGINAGVADFAEVDPPYGINLQKKKGRNRDLHRVDRYNEIPHDEYRDFLDRSTKLVYRALKNHTFCIWWFGNIWYSHVFKALSEAGFAVNPVPGIWFKESFQGQTASPDTSLASCYEPFLVARKGQPKLAKPGRRNVFVFEPVAPQNKIHPTQRPVELMDEIMDTFTTPNSIVICPFLGSGVTLRSAYRRGHTGFGWEMEEMCKERFLNAVFADQQPEGES